MKKLLTACITSALIMGSSLAKADWLSETELSANVAYTTDYLFYGATQTNGGPAVWAGKLANGLSWDFGGWFYTYPDQDSDSGSASDFDYVEAYANFGYTFDGALSPSIGVGVYYSPDYFGSNNDSIYIPVGLDITLPNDFGLYFSYGYFEVDQAGTDSYSHYGFGLTKTLLGVDLDLSWTGNDNDCEVVQGVNCGGVVFAAYKSF